MSEEEKKAIEKLEIEGTENNILEVRILLNLVDKQQEEIESLKSRLDFIAKQIEQCTNATEQMGYWASLEEK